MGIPQRPELRNNYTGVLRKLTLKLAMVVMEFLAYGQMISAFFGDPSVRDLLSRHRIAQ
jgi:hypothetical protein